jgi:ligand-binding sensor domain-containing protein/signal transduction histidine kinase
LAVAGLFGLGAPWSTPAGGYFLNVWQTKQGLPENAITAITQSKDGYLWLGTYSGLVRFDGMRFVVFDNNSTPELRGSRVTALYEDEGGGLWIGQETGWLACYKDGRFTILDAAVGGKSRRLFAMGVDEDGDLWTLDHQGVIVRQKDSLPVVPPPGTAAGQVAFAIDSAHRLWVARQGKLSRLDHGRLVLNPLGERGDMYVQGICASRAGGLWVASEGRLRKWREGKGFDDLGPAPWGLSGLTVFSEMQNGLLAAGTVESGLFLDVSSTNFLHFDRDNGLQNWIRSLCQDREGNLWVGAGSAGLVALRAAKVETVNPTNHWQGHTVRSVIPTAAHELWIGTEGAGIYRLAGKDWHQFGEEAGLSNSFVWSVSQDSQGRIWAGTFEGGVFIRSQDRFERVPGLEDLRAAVTAVLHSSNEVTWIGTGNGLLRYEKGKVTAYGETEGLIKPQVRTIAQDADGTVWFGMFGGGLGRIRDGSVRQFLPSDGLSSDSVQCLKVEPDAIWIGTLDAGLNRLKNGRFASITRKNGLSDNVICDLQEDNTRHLWISSHAGIMRLSRDDLDRCADGATNWVPCLTYGDGEGMPTLECSGGMYPAGCKTSDGRLWFPTSRGLVAVDPTEIKKNLLPPRALIEDFLVDGKSQTEAGSAVLPAGRRIEVAPGKHRFEFRYTGLSFTDPEKVQFKSFLEGLDSRWTEPVSSRFVPYPYLPPGDYTFRVLACNNDGIWADQSASIGFRVHPQLWQTWWFRTLAGTAGAGLIAGSVLVATRRRMKLKFERLEHQRAIERERTRIAKDIHDDLGASLTRITLLSQSARAELNDPAAAGDLDRIYDTARELTRAMDEIVWAVNPRHDTLDSLATYLGRFAQGFLATADIRCRLDVPMQLPGWPLTAEIRHNLFLAFKEALHNAVKHAQTGEVRISIVIDEAGFSLRLEDFGRGFEANGWQRSTFDPARPGAGNGLANMRERLAEIGGRCDIKSGPGDGTTIVFVVPVRIAMA